METPSALPERREEQSVAGKRRIGQTGQSTWPVHTVWRRPRIPGHPASPERVLKEQTVCPLTSNAFQTGTFVRHTMNVMATSRSYDSSQNTPKSCLVVNCHTVLPACGPHRALLVQPPPPSG